MINGDANNCGPARFGGGILVVDGIIYASAPSNVYAIDARDGTLLWHYYWKTRGGTALQTRGVGVWHNYVYFSMHDDWVVCLDAKTGKELWTSTVVDYTQGSAITSPPTIVKNLVVTGFAGGEYGVRGAIVAPASPGFYTHPDSVDDMVDFVASRVFDLCGIDNALVARWGER